MVGTPEGATGPPRDGERDDPIDAAIGVVADETPVDGLRAPHEPQLVDRQAVGEASAVGGEPHEGSPVRDRSGLGVEVVGEDRVAEALRVVHRAAVGAPPGPVRTPDVIDHARDPSIGIEPVDGARRRLPITGAHGPRPESSLRIAPGIVEPVPRSIGLRIGEDLEVTGLRIVEGERLAEREHQATPLAERDGCDPIRHVEHAMPAVGRTVGVDLLPADVDEVELLRALAPHRRFVFRHALLAEAIYTTILPGEREELHARLAQELARSGAASPAELAPHWEAAGRSTEALAASVEAARQAEAVFGLAEAWAHLERALALWPEVPDAAELAGLDLAELCTWTAELAGEVGAAARAVELGRRAIDLVGAGDPHRAALLHVRLGEYLYATGSTNALLAAFERAVELVPAEPASPERAYALGSLAGGLMVAWRHAESLAIGEQALALARDVGAGKAEVRALTVLGGDLAYLGRGEEGLALFREALLLAEEIGDRIGLERAYVNCTDALTMLGRLRESASLARSGLDAMRRYGIESALLISNRVEALLAIGEWDEAERLSATALRRITSSFPYWLLIIRAAVEIGRGEFDAARAHLDVAGTTLREDGVLGLYDAHLAELALWERRWTDADAAVQAGLVRARHREAAQIRIQLCAKGLRAQAELAALARARRDADAVRDRQGRAGKLLATARRAAANASAITPDVAGWLALAEAEHDRARGGDPPRSWSDAATTWDLLERPPLAAYCRWRQAEGLVAAGASRAAASVPLREAHAVATRIGAAPLLHQVELLAQRARLDPTPQEAAPAAAKHSLQDVFGLTTRETEVLTLVARGLTNREIAAELIISAKTASVHVSHILRKLDAPNRLEAAAIAHRLDPPPTTRRFQPSTAPRGLQR